MKEWLVDFVVEREIEGDIWKRILSTARKDDLCYATSWVNVSKAKELGIRGGETQKLLDNKLIMCEECFGKNFDYDNEGIDCSSLICHTKCCGGGRGQDYNYFVDLVNKS